jgi:hypothetical protein
MLVCTIGFYKYNLIGFWFNTVNFNIQIKETIAIATLLTFKFLNDYGVIGEGDIRRQRSRTAVKPRIDVFYR